MTSKASKRNLSWNEFNDCIERITSSCKHKNLSGVYGFPRGGICLAVALSHSLSIPYLDKPQKRSLVVDDIYETGLTMRNVMNIPEITCFVWISKVRPDWWSAIEIIDPAIWAIFPWEDPNQAEKDEKAYRLSRYLMK